MEMLWKAVLMILLANLIFGVFLWYRVRKLYRYPNVLGFPVIGNLYYFYRTLFIFTMPSAYTAAVSAIKDNLKEDFGFHFISGSKIMLLVLCPELTKKLSLHPNLADKSETIYGGFQYAADGPFSQIESGKEWKVMRKDYNIALKKSRIDNDYYRNIIRGSEKMLDMILASSSTDFDASAIFNGFALNVSLKNLHGFETNMADDLDILNIFEKMNELLSLMGTNSSLVGVLHWLVEPILNYTLGKKSLEIRNLVVEVANKKLNSNQCPEAERPLSVLVASRRSQNNTREKLFSELTEMFLTTAHTTSSTLSNSAYFLATLPDIQERAWQEQNEIFGDDDREPTIDDLNQMHFLDRFIKESLRFLGPTVIARKASADITIDELTIPRDTTVIYMLRYMRFHPKYLKNPNVFDPDRFLEESDSLKLCYIPFGFGARSCPGTHYATVTMKIALSKIIRRLKIRPAEKGFRFEDLKIKTVLFAEVENPPKLIFEKRA